MVRSILVNSTPRFTAEDKPLSQPIRCDQDLPVTDQANPSATFTVNPSPSYDLSDQVSLVQCKCFDYGPRSP